MCGKISSFLHIQIQPIVIFMIPLTIGIKCKIMTKIKKLIFAQTLLFTFFFMSCKEEHGPGLFKAQYVYVNESGHEVIIERQIKDELVLYRIEDKKSLVFEIESESSSCYVNGILDGNLQGNNGSLLPDFHIKITFEGQNAVEFNDTEDSDLDLFNILTSYNYETVKDERKLKIIRYTFTKEFYEAVSDLDNTSAIDLSPKNRSI